MLCIAVIKNVDGQNSENEEVTVITDMEIETPDVVSEISQHIQGKELVGIVRERL